MGLIRSFRRWANRRKAGRVRGQFRRRALGDFQKKLDRKLNTRRRQWDAEDSELRQVMALASGGQPGGWTVPTGRRDLAEMRGRITRQPAHAHLAAGYDSAQTTDDNSTHWRMADQLAADAANLPAIRSILRSRARYEVANNCYARGVGESIANDLVGTGPRLHLDDERLTPEQRAYVEAEFAAWCKAIRLAEKLRTMRKARRQDGEAFAMPVNNDRLATPVKLDLRLIEAEQIGNPAMGAPTATHIDGIILDGKGNPLKYELRQGHPGDPAQAGQSFQVKLIDAADMIHWYRQDRPGQHRGLPEILPALPLYATLRRYTQATLDAAETAADYAVLLETQSGAMFYDEDGQEVTPEAANAFSTMDLKRRMMAALPAGYTAKQMQPEHPSQEYSPFKREICGEIGRCENVSLNVVLGDSSQSNFASGTLDHTIYFKPRQIEREDVANLILDRLFAAWLEEASLIEPGSGGPAYLPQPLRIAGASVSHTWHWDSNELGDPLKLAVSKRTLLTSGLVTIPELYAARNQDWRRAFTAGAAALGVSFEDFQELVRDSIFAGKADPATGDDNPDAPPDGGDSAVVRPKQGAVRRATAA